MERLSGVLCQWANDDEEGYLCREWCEVDGPGASWGTIVQRMRQPCLLQPKGRKEQRDCERKDTATDQSRRLQLSYRRATSLLERLIIQHWQRGRMYDEMYEECSSRVQWSATVHRAEICPFHTVQHKAEPSLDLQHYESVSISPSTPASLPLSCSASPCSLIEWLVRLAAVVLFVYLHCPSFHQRNDGACAAELALPSLGRAGLLTAGRARARHEFSYQWCR